MGPRAVPHLPCSFACGASVDFANRLMALGRELGHGAEMEWLEEILNWPASWSALHGIAEVKTPVLKASTRTDATAHEFVVHRRGRRVPDEAAAGLGFPFERPIDRASRIHWPSARVSRRPLRSTPSRRGGMRPTTVSARVRPWTKRTGRLSSSRSPLSARPGRCLISAAATGRC